MIRNPLLIFLKGSIISTAAMVVTGLVTYLTRRYLALHLTEEEFGFFYAAFAFVSLLGALLDFGVSGATPVIIGKHAVLESGDEKKANYTAILLLKLFLGLWGFLIIPAAGWLASWYFRFPYGQDVFVILLVYSIVFSLTNELLVVAIGFKDYLGKAVMESIFYSAVLVIILFSLQEYGLKGAAWGYLGSSLIVTLFGGGYLVYKYRIRIAFDLKLVWKKTVDLAHFSKWMAIATLASTSMGYIDTVMLTYMKGLEATAIYNIALPIVQIMKSMLFLPLVFIPIATELWHKKELGAISDICNAVMMLALAAFWVVVMFMSFFGRYLVSLLFADKFLAASAPLTILGSGILFLLIAQFFIAAISAIERLRAVAYIGISGVVFNIIFNTVLIPFLGIEGAALATSLSYFTIFIFAFVVLKRDVPNLRLLYPWTLNIPGSLLAGTAIYLGYQGYSLSIRILIFLGLIGIFLICNFKAIFFLLRHLIKQLLNEF
ncbi:MAG: oligosaccharide flippase family protein [Lentisphaerae bacterium]|nr:oligosaccharide flippase family protein [Lentisphaerota bacterium]MCP4103502.1 oligosaccharide flippase family protein [Lentisphaerota bacterium]